MNYYTIKSLLPDDGTLVLVWAMGKPYLARRIKSYWHPESRNSTPFQTQKDDKWALLEKPQ